MDPADVPLQRLVLSLDLAAVAGTSRVAAQGDAGAIFDAIAETGVTHFCGAPIVLNMVINASDAGSAALPHTVEVMTAAAPPPAAVLQAMEREGFHITHVYGLTEVYGPAVVCAWQDEWDELLDDEERAAEEGAPGRALRRAGGAQMVADPETLEPVPRDGETLGEVFMRGNIVMKGYLKNPTASAGGVRRRLVPHRRPGGDGTRTATSRSRTAPRTSSSPAARTSPRSRWSVSCSPPRRAGGRRRRQAGREMGRSAGRLRQLKTA